ncbi:uncharacterized protein IUM83_00419 [Phytophthora cinnamomi]|uniref:uncharacterized protein n=1 Tax=Phytophthora cinnamomi TaxID=4785 RepID=UPI00355ACAE3|nr:hypothetical protein IUM83_00419 [Phytophthora cinnamomi]
MPAGAEPIRSASVVATTNINTPAAAAPSNSTPGAAVASSSFPMAAEPIRGVRAAARTSTITPGATPSPRTHAAATASSRPPAAAKYELSQRVSKEANPSAPEPGNSTAVAGAGAVCSSTSAHGNPDF